MLIRDQMKCGREIKRISTSRFHHLHETQRIISIPTNRPHWIFIWIKLHTSLFILLFRMNWRFHVTLMNLTFSTADSLKVLTGHFTKERSVWTKTNWIFSWELCCFLWMLSLPSCSGTISIRCRFLLVFCTLTWSALETEKKERNDTSRHPEDKQSKAWVTPLDRDLSARQRVKIHNWFSQRKTSYTPSFPEVHDTIDDLSRHLHRGRERSSG